MLSSSGPPIIVKVVRMRLSACAGWIREVPPLAFLPLIRVMSAFGAAIR
jgi:hypothetical protein